MNMGTVIDLQSVKLREMVKSVASRNGMDKQYVAKINKLDSNMFSKEVANSIIELNTIAGQVGDMLDNIRFNDIRAQDSPIYAYCMFSFVREILERQRVSDPTEENKIAIQEITEYQDECKYLFLETDMYYKVLKMIL